MTLGFLGAWQLLDTQAARYTDSQVTFYYLSCIIAANLVYFFINRYVASVTWLAAQLIFDCLFATGLIYLTGNVNSPFNAVYFATIVASAIIVGGRLCYAIASLATIGQAVVTGLYFYDAQGRPLTLWFLPPIAHNNGNRPIAFYAYFLLIQAVSYYTVAFLAAKLSDMLREGRFVQEEILQNLDEAVVVTDRDNRVMYVNHRAEEYFGNPAEPLRYANLVTILNRWSPALARLVLEHAEGIYEQDISIRGGALLPLQFSVAPFRDRHGNAYGMILVARDRTANRELETSRVTISRMQALSEMAAGIAHEIRNPLASIRGSVQELNRQAPEGVDQRLLKIIIKESDRLNNIIGEFLSFATLKKAVFAKCDLSGLLEDIAYLFRRREDAVRVEVRLPAKTETVLRVLVQADQELLRQVFLNLILNAAEAMQFAGVIDIRLRAEQRYVTCTGSAGEPVLTRMPGIAVEIQDHGPGIAPDAMSHLFTPFYTTKQQGTGLGLATVSRIVNEHRGLIVVQNHAGGGAVFSIWLPEAPERILMDRNARTL